ncbi:MAG TPA: PIN domain nuclease [Thermoanaerobaculia bacterium]|nr:PIN domain nuclease [Thermoanaerobaculia bacterium]
MRVLVDTSVWVDYLNGYPSRESEALDQLFDRPRQLCTCGVVVTEVFQGLRRDKNRTLLADRFRQLSFLEPASIDLYFRAAGIYREMRQRGYTVRSTIDCLIVALAEAGGAAILARDRDLSAILDSGLVEVKRWPVSQPPVE